MRLWNATAIISFSYCFEVSNLPLNSFLVLICHNVNMRYTKLFTAFVLSLVSLQLQAQTDNSRFAPNLIQLLEHTKTSSTIKHHTVTTQITRNKSIVSLLMKVNSSIDEEGLRKLGAIVGTKAGNIWTLRVPIENLKAVTELKGIVYMEVAQQVRVQMDSARYAANIDSVIQGAELPMPLHGKGVVVGVIDGGFDYTHPAFYDTSYSYLRIKKAWVQGIAGTPPLGYTYGAEFSDSASLLQKQYDFDLGGSHGTACAGIAAGSGIGSKNAPKGIGIASESELVLVSSPLTYLDWREVNMTSIIDGLNYIYTYAESVGKPAVVNISMGSIVGARDGGSLFAQACDNLTGAGKILVISAMNNRDTKAHITKRFSAADTMLQTIVPIQEIQNGEKRNYIDAWGDSLKTFCLQFGMYRNGTVINNSAVYCMDNSAKDFFIIGSDNDTCYITITTKTSEYNTKPHATIDIFTKSNDTLCVSVIAHDGAVHMWQEYFDESWYTYWGDFIGNGSWATEGDGDYTIGEMGCTKTAITVGASVSRVNFKNLKNQTLYVPKINKRGMLAYFSSKGPTLDNRMKPDITAPGAMIYVPCNSYDLETTPTGSGAAYLVSKYTSSHNGRTYYYDAGAGTSYASPMVAGVVALMLEVNPKLSPNEIKAILSKTALKDTFTTATPDSSLWGAGKINAYAAIKETIAKSGAVSIPKSELAINVYPNPTTGEFTISYESPLAGHFYVEIANTAGQIITSEAWQLSQGKNQKDFSLHEFPKGMYFVSITGKGGHVVKKIVLN